MNETRLLSAWHGFLGSTALIAIIVLGFCVMVRAVKSGDVPRHLGVVVGIVILLIMLPAIIVSLWNSMFFGQHVGSLMIGIAIIFLLNAMKHNQGKRDADRRTTKDKSFIRKRFCLLFLDCVLCAGC